MVCKNCGIELKENEKFCPQCGQAATPVENSKPELETPKVETPENQPPKGSTSESGTAKPQSAQWDTVKENLRQGAEKAAPILKAGFGKAKENLQQGAEKAAPILKAGFGKAKEFTAQTVHEFKDAAADVKGAGVSGASVAVAAKKINWKRLVPVAVVLVLLIFVVRACGGGGYNKNLKTDNGTYGLRSELSISEFIQNYHELVLATAQNEIDIMTSDISDNFEYGGMNSGYEAYSYNFQFGTIESAIVLLTSDGYIVEAKFAMDESQYKRASGDISGVLKRGAYMMAALTGEDIKFGIQAMEKLEKVPHYYDKGYAYLCLLTDDGTVRICSVATMTKDMYAQIT